MKGLIVIPGAKQDEIFEGELFGALNIDIKKNIVFGEFVFNNP